MEEGELSYVVAKPGSGNQTTIQVGVLLILHALLTIALYHGAGLKKKSQKLHRLILYLLYSLFFGLYNGIDLPI